PADATKRPGATLARRGCLHMSPFLLVVRVPAGTGDHVCRVKDGGIRWFRRFTLGFRSHGVIAQIESGASCMQAIGTLAASEAALCARLTVAEKGQPKDERKALTRRR